jgi:hypothetical protein
MSNARVRRVDDTDKLHEKIDDYQFRGFSVVERSDTQARLQNNDYGTVGMHLLWAFLTIWWTAGLGNLAYLIYAYQTNSKEVMLKVEE